MIRVWLVILCIFAGEDLSSCSIKAFPTLPLFYVRLKAGVPWDLRMQEEFPNDSSSQRSAGGSGGLFGQGSKGRGGGQKPISNSVPKASTQSSPKVNGNSGPKKLLEIPASEVKVGSLRFLLQMFLAGEVQHVPVKGSWVTRQGDADGEIQCYYRDGTGMVSIELQPKKIEMKRHGQTPSLVYQLQESVLLHSVLDELNKIAFEVDNNIDYSKRLLQLKDDNDIERARKLLPARSEK